MIDITSKKAPKTGARCGCKKGIQRDNCLNCEGTGWAINFWLINEIREQNRRTK
jgi:hypothetical protein